MKRATMLKIVNPVLALLAINQLVTALLHDTLSHEAFEVLHAGAGLALAVVALIHLLLNWSWVKANFLPRKKADAGE